MRISRLIASLMVLLSLAAAAHAAEEPADISTFAGSMLTTAGVPGIAIAAADSDGIIAWGVGGKRAANADAPIQRHDRFHIGSLTKSMTATLIARYVERGEIDWESTVSEVLPDLVEQIPEHARSITVRQLLSHRSGLGGDRGGGGLLMQMWSLSGPMIEQRAKVTKAVLSDERNAKPDSGFEYSNAGYIIAGHMLEEITGDTWETLIERELFNPLGMSTAGQGPPGMDPEVGPQPLGHGRAGDSFNPIPAVLGADNPPPLGPAGRAHCSIEDLTRYAQEHLRGLRGTDGLVSAASFKELHRDPESDGYALGWGISGEGKDQRSAHTGSNMRWFAIILIWPERDLTITAAMNAMPSGSGADLIKSILMDLHSRGLIDELPDS